MKKWFGLMLVLSALGTLGWSASKGKPSPTPEGTLFKKISPHMAVEAQIETLESRYGRRVVLMLTAQKSYDNLQYKIQFHPEIELLESSALEGQASLAESETLVLNYLFDVRDLTDAVVLQVTAYEEMADRKRYGIAEMFEVYRPAGALKSEEESMRFPPDKAKRIFQ